MVVKGEEEDGLKYISLFGICAGKERNHRASVRKSQLGNCTRGKVNGHQESSPEQKEEQRAGGEVVRGREEGEYTQEGRSKQNGPVALGEGGGLAEKNRISKYGRSSSQGQDAQRLSFLLQMFNRKIRGSMERMRERQRESDSKLSGETLVGTSCNDSSFTPSSSTSPSPSLKNFWVLPTHIQPNITPTPTLYPLQTCSSTSHFPSSITSTHICGHLSTTLQRLHCNDNFEEDSPTNHNNNSFNMEKSTANKGKAPGKPPVGLSTILPHNPHHLPSKRNHSPTHTRILKQPN